MALVPLTRAKDIAEALDALGRRLEEGAEPLVREVGCEDEAYTVYRHPDHGFWAAIQPCRKGHHRCMFGTINPVLRTSLPLVCEVSLAVEGVDDERAAVFLRDAEGRVYLAHTGKTAHRDRGAGMVALAQFTLGGTWLSVTWPSGEARRVMVIACLASEGFLAQVASFVHMVAGTKNPVARPQRERAAPTPISTMKGTGRARGTGGRSSATIQPADVASVVRQTPLFTSEPLRQRLAVRLRRCVPMDVPVCHLGLSPFVMQTLEGLGVSTIGSLLLTPGRTLLGRPRFKREHLQATQKRAYGIIVRSYDVAATLDYRSFDGLVETSVGCVVKPGRARRVMGRLGIFPGSAESAHGVGSGVPTECSMTRDELETLRRRLEVIEGFWHVVAGLLRRSGGVSATTELVHDLAAYYHWAASPSAASLVAFLWMDERLRTSSDGSFVWTTRSRCASCRAAKAHVLGLVGGGERRIHMLDVQHGLLEMCAAKCGERRRRSPFGYSRFLRLLLASIPEAVVEGDYVYSVDRWRFLHSDGLATVAQRTLKELAEPTHYGQIAERIRASVPRFRDVSDQRVRAALREAGECRPVGRGVYALPEMRAETRETYAKAIGTLLREHGGAMPVADIISALVPRGYKEKVIRLRLSTGTDFVRVGRGMYALREEQTRDATRSANDLVVDFGESGEEDIPL